MNLDLRAESTPPIRTKDMKHRLQGGRARPLSPEAALVQSLAEMTCTRQIHDPTFGTKRGTGWFKQAQVSPSESIRFSSSFMSKLSFQMQRTIHRGFLPGQKAIAACRGQVRHPHKHKEQVTGSFTPDSECEWWAGDRSIGWEAGEGRGQPRVCFLIYQL